MSARRSTALAPRLLGRHVGRRAEDHAHLVPAAVAWRAAVNVGEFMASAVALTPSGASALARPKSRTFTVPSARTLMLAGFRSRWTMPCSCAASRASAICLAIGSASATGIAPLATTHREVLALDELHDEGMHVAPAPTRVRRGRRLDDAVDLRDVGVIQRGERLRLAREAGDAIGVVRDGVGQDLDGDVAVQLRVAAHDRPRPFRPRRSADDVVGAEPAAGSNIQMGFPCPIILGAGGSGLVECLSVRP